DHYADLPFILYTGKGSEEIAAQAINAGVTGYLQKGGPDQHRRLANRVKHAATEYRAQIESERYSTVLRALDYPIYVVNAEAEFEYVNEAFLDLVGYDREAIIGSPPGKIKTDEGVQRANDMLATIVSSAGPETQQFRVDIHTKDGETVPCYDHMAALPFDDEFRGSVGILRDATREQRQREELIRQNKRLDEFTSIVSHDLRTPLQNAKTAAEMARAES
ncbi:PAS domain S-box protein, partial [Halorubrum sp. SD626R]